MVTLLVIKPAGVVMNNSPLENCLRIQISSLYGIDFQRFIIQLLRIEHGQDVVDPLRESGDDGADCLVRVNRPYCVACFAPDSVKKPTTRAITTKINEDYAKYQKNWQNTYPEWHFYTNQAVAPAHIKIIDAFGSHCQIFGEDKIRFRILTMSRIKATPLFLTLNIEKDLYAKDLLRILFDDLLTGEFAATLNNDPVIPPDIDEKIQINCNDEEADLLRSMLFNTTQQQRAVLNTLKEYENNEITAIKHQTQRLYGKYISEKTSGFNKIQRLTDDLQARYNPEEDSEIQLYIDAFVFYIFTQCLIGIAPTGVR